MKKIISILFAISLCGAFSVCAFAADEDDTTTTVVASDEQISDVYDQVSDVIDDLGILDNSGDFTLDADSAQTAIDNLTNTLSGLDLDKADLEALIAQLEEYASGAGLDLSTIFSDTGALEDFLGYFLGDAGVDASALLDKIQESGIGDLFLSLYYSAPKVTTTKATTTKATTTVPETTSFVKTGDSTTTTTLAAVVLGVLSLGAGAGFVVMNKKKEN